MAHLTRDQQRAQHAYLHVPLGTTVKEYSILINTFGANVVRSGLAAAVAFLQRDSNEHREDFGRALSKAFPSEFKMGTDLASMAERVRSMPLEDYMLASREALLIVQWFRRAAQAAKLRK